jgi:hypothetical protein
LSQSENCHEWQVKVLSIIFFVLFAGNFWTSYSVVRRKFRDALNKNLGWVKFKYQDWKKLRTPSEEKNTNGDSKVIGDASTAKNKDN